MILQSCYLIGHVASLEGVMMQLKMIKEKTLFGLAFYAIYGFMWQNKQKQHYYICNIQTQQILKKCAVLK